MERRMGTLERAHPRRIDHCGPWAAISTTDATTRLPSRVNIGRLALASPVMRRAPSGFLVSCYSDTIRCCGRSTAITI